MKIQELGIMQLKDEFCQPWSNFLSCLKGKQIQRSHINKEPLSFSKGKISAFNLHKQTRKRIINRI